MGLREVLIIVMVLVIAVILYDGFRRVRMAREGSLKMKIKPSRFPADDYDDEEDEVDYSAELPSGGARTVSRELDDSSDDTAVPMLMESVAGEERQEESREEEPAEEQQDLFDQPMMAGERITDVPSGEPGNDVASENAGPVRDVVVIHVMSKGDEVFQGRELLNQLLACGMRFGDMNIFHRFTSPSGQGELLFSMANAIEPGTFDIDNMEESETRGVSFFLQMPGPGNPGQALDTMIEVTSKLAREMDGDLQDENRSVLTKQTIEHMRNRVQEFVRQERLRS